MPLEIGKVVDGTVTGITNFGAFIQLPDGDTGLCHISEIADEYVKDVKDYLKESQTVKVKIIEMNGEIINKTNITKTRIIYEFEKIDYICPILFIQMELCDFTVKDYLMTWAEYDSIDEKINILAISTSEIKLSVIIDEDNTLNAIKKLHTIFDLD